LCFYNYNDAKFPWFALWVFLRGVKEYFRGK